ncbi:MAG: O-antigen ligase family protein [Planctomycetales bacterium]|nr:O-antigen ligase family protein [Planctomycetales bacterium]
MSTTIAALFATLITTGMTSAVSHDITIVGGSIVTVIFAASTIVRRDASVYPVFLIGTISMVVIALVSSEANTSPFSSTIHVLSMYVALIGLAFSSRDLSSFCQQLMMGTNLLLTGWVLYQGYDAEPLKAWQISNPTGGANVMAAQINMTLPLILVRIRASIGQKRLAYIALICLNCIAVVVVMSRNGIGAMLIILTLYFLFNHKRMAVVVVGVIFGVASSLDGILQIPLVYNVVVRLRFVGYKPVAPRSLIWRVAWDHVKTHPMLGVGPGGPKKALAVIDTYHAHNNFVQVALETGIPSATIFSLLILLLLALPARTLLQTRDRFVVTLPILAYASYSWTAMPFTYPGMTLLLAACVHEARIAIRAKVRLPGNPVVHRRYFQQDVRQKRHDRIAQESTLFHGCGD